MKGGRIGERIHTHRHTHTHTRIDTVSHIKREIGFLKIPEIQQKVRQVVFCYVLGKKKDGNLSDGIHLTTRVLVTRNGFTFSCFELK